MTKTKTTTTAEGLSQKIVTEYRTALDAERQACERANRARQELYACVRTWLDAAGLSVTEALHVLGGEDTCF